MSIGHDLQNLCFIYHILVRMLVSAFLEASAYCSRLGSLVGRENPGSRISSLGTFGPCSKWLCAFKPKQCLALKQIWSIYVNVAHWRARLGRDIYYMDCGHKTTAIVVVDTPWRISCLCSLWQRSILRTNTTLMVILPAVRVGNVQRWVLFTSISYIDHLAPIHVRHFTTV
jgi:hypothetical protein